MRVRGEEGGKKNEIHSFGTAGRSSRIISLLASEQLKLRAVAMDGPRANVREDALLLPAAGEMGARTGPAAPLGPRCAGDHRGEWALNATRDWAGLGTLHPRMKRPIGQRLAQGLHATAYGGSAPVSGPGPLEEALTLGHVWSASS